LDDISLDGRTLKRILKKEDGKTWTGLIWIKTEKGGALKEINLLWILDL